VSFLEAKSMKLKQIESFEKVDSQLQALFEEVGELAKKKPDGPINKFKLGIINGIIRSADEVLGTSYKPLPDFIGFDSDEMPTNSDVVMVCGQYLSCLEKLRADNIENNMGRWVWRSDGKLTSIRTGPPKKINAKD
jgi:hypothetical protein